MENGLSETELSQKLNEAIVAGDQAAIDALMKTELKQEAPAPVKAEESAEVVVTTTLSGEKLVETPSQETTEKVEQEPVKPVTPKKVEAAPPAPKDGTAGDQQDKDLPTKERDGEKTTPSAADRLRERFSKMDEDTRKDIIALFEQQAQLGKERDDYKHRFDSNAGRISAFQRTIADLQSQNSLLKAGQPPSKDAGKETKLPATRENPHFKQLQEADPHLAGTLEGILEAERKSLIDFYEGRNKDTRDEILKAEEARYIASQQEIVRSQIPNIDEVVNSEPWKEWLTSASQGVQRLAGSPHAADGLEAVGIYVNWLHRTKPELFKQPEEQKPTPPAPPAAPAERVQEVLDARNRRLKATEVGSAPAPKPAAALDVNDPDALYKSIWEQVRPGYNIRR